MYQRAASKLISLRAMTRASFARRSFFPNTTCCRAKSSVATVADDDDVNSITSASYIQSRAVPDYMKDVYWWAYLHPNAVRIFERQWLVNAILWGNFTKLRDAAIQELMTDNNCNDNNSEKHGEISGRTLQIACVYGDFTQRIVQCMADDSNSSLVVVDVAPIQIQNLHEKLSHVSSEKNHRVQLRQQNAAYLDLETDSFDQVILFFLLHEMPLDVRKATVAQAVRVLRPGGGKLVLVDYHQPTSQWHPHRYFMPLVLNTLEPFAMDLWKTDLQEWLPTDDNNLSIRKELYFGGLYQKVVVTKM